MIPREVRATIEQRFPGVMLYDHESPYVHGFAVELHGLRNGWMLKGTEESWAKVTEQAVAWLQKVEHDNALRSDG